MSIIETTMEIPAAHAGNIFGKLDSHVKILEKHLGVTLVFRDGTLKIVGNGSHVKKAEKIIEIGRTTRNIFRKFITGQCLEATILGILSIIGMLILKVPYAVPIGVLIGVTALIPIVGAFIGIIIGAVLILSAAPMKVITFIIYILMILRPPTSSRLLMSGLCPSRLKRYITVSDSCYHALTMRIAKKNSVSGTQIIHQEKSNHLTHPYRFFEESLLLSPQEFSD